MLDLVSAFGLAAGVLVLAALAAGFVERAPLSFPILFLGLGFFVGPWGVGLFDVTLHSPSLEAVGVLTLALVLFLDAVHLDVRELRRDWKVPALVLGPGTAIVIALIAALGVGLLGFGLATALLLGAILSSTDPVVLRDTLRDARIPQPVRRALAVEAGTNDMIVLPVILVLLALTTGGSQAAWPLALAQILLLGPAVGFAVGGLGAEVMARIDRWVGVRHEYQAMYGLGLVLASYVAGEAVGGDGFLAAFAAGFAVTALNTHLCDCFLDFGQVVTEMTMMVAFVMFGAALSTVLGAVPILPALALAGLALLLVRPLAVAGVLLPRRRHLSWAARGVIAWSGPRGLNSLLFALLAFTAGGAGTTLFAAVGVVVTVSVVIHGVAATPLSAAYARYTDRHTTGEERARSANELFGGARDPSSQPHPRK